VSNSVLAILAAVFAVASFLVLIWIGHSNFGQRAMGLGVGVALLATFLATLFLTILSYRVHLSTFTLLLASPKGWLNDPVFGWLPLPAAAALLVAVTAFAASQIFGACLTFLFFDHQQPQARRVALFHLLCLLLSLTALLVDAFFWGCRFYLAYDLDSSEINWSVSKGFIASIAGAMYFCAMTALGVWLHYLARLFRALAIGPSQQQARAVQQLPSTQQSQVLQVPAHQQLQQSAPDRGNGWDGFDEGANSIGNDENDWRNFAPLTQRRDAR
jgi:hypothetical protein